MKARQIAAFVIGTIGFLLIAGALGQAEFSAIWVDEFYIKSGIGLLLMFAALPLWGEYKEDSDTDKKSRR